MGEERHQHEHRHARSDDLTGVLAPEETAMSRRRPFLHMPVPWVFVAAYLLGVGVQLLVPVHLNSPAASLAIRIAGGVLFLAGAGLAAWGLLLFRKAATTTVPGEAPKELVTRGALPAHAQSHVRRARPRLSRRGRTSGSGMASPFPAACSCLVNWFVIPVEEATLRRIDGYARYCAAVRRWV